MKLLGTPETIGPPDCPLFYRWELASGRWGKLMLHHFLPNAADPDCHNHPWAFYTFVLFGGYTDMVPCDCCDGTNGSCPVCGGVGLIVGDRLRTFSFRRRRATYAHSTRTDDSGAWTMVFARPKSRDWGFWREARWWPFREYEERFGFAMRCDER